MSQQAASCTRGAPVAQEPNRPPTPLGMDSLTYPPFAASGKWVLCNRNSTRDSQALEPRENQGLVKSFTKGPLP